ELSVTDVDRIHACRTVLQQAVGEAAGRGADVDRDDAQHVDGKVRERALELLAAARAVALELGHAQRSVLGHELADFVDPALTEEDLARENAGLSARPALDQAQLHKSNICASFFHGLWVGLARRIATNLPYLAEPWTMPPRHWESLWW